MHRLLFLLQLLDQAADPLNRKRVEALGYELAIPLNLRFELLALVTHGSPLIRRERAALSVIDNSHERGDDEHNYPISRIPDTAN
jgi:hypothetical protein